MPARIAGPDLTHLASRPHARRRRAARRTARTLAAWIADPQAHKPGTQHARPSRCSRRQLADLVDYLMT